MDRVAGMGMKEVQIWFQNRRQSTRRRTLPVSFDVAQDGFSRQAPILMVQDSFASNGEINTDGDLSQPAPQEGSFTRKTVVSSQPDEIAHTPRVTAAPSTAPYTWPRPSTAHTNPSAAIPAASRSLKRSASAMRLSQSSDGAAKLLAADESSPSPPRPERHLTGLLDMPAYNALMSTNSPPSHTSRRSLKPRRAPAGRSRDSRAWEFWCDSEARGALERRAAQEETGEASAAISLMRSQSSGTGGSRQAPSAMDHSDPTARPAKRPRTAMKERAQSDVSALLNTQSGRRAQKKGNFELFDEEAGRNVSSVQKGSMTTEILRSLDAESDKENVDPNARAGPAPRRTAASSANVARPSLQKRRTAPGKSQRSALGAISGTGKEKRGFAHETDKELQAFMKGGEKPADDDGMEQDDLNCVKSLLFLSQGH